MPKSNLERLLNQGEFTVTAEIGPPKSADPEIIHEHAKMLKGYVDAANLTDCQTAIVRISSIASAYHCMAEGFEPIIQMTCRDRNRIAMQADILGAYSMGIRNILCLSGDHQKFGNHPTAKNVHDIDSIQLINMCKRMRDDEEFACGEKFKSGAPKDLFIGCAANPFADPFEWRVMRLEKKINAGAQFVQTQCIFDMERFAKFMEMYCERGLHERAKLTAGVTPIKALGAAKYMAKNVAGMIVPDSLIERLEKANKEGGKDAVREEGVNICVEQIKQLKEMKGVAGIHIMAIAWEDIVPSLVERAGLLPRPAVKE
ncbi:methylenetetrahydrofolate reductase [Desulfolucanica intricata]|uniref:methylenetetrahydrofolate reductase n=1 Tax=Desulfolucanica intricata TaxID=1285191 RepID=UPI000833B6D2|nr:methylenetetrahydrofolate reductase [Desulfolucanica intricata]